MLYETDDYIGPVKKILIALLGFKIGFAWQILVGTVVAFGVMMSGRRGNV